MKMLERLFQEPQTLRLRLCAAGTELCVRKQQEGMAGISREALTASLPFPCRKVNLLDLRAKRSSNNFLALPMRGKSTCWTGGSREVLVTSLSFPCGKVNLLDLKVPREWSQLLWTRCYWLSCSLDSVQQHRLLHKFSGHLDQLLLHKIKTKGGDMSINMKI